MVPLFDNMQTMFILVPRSYVWNLQKHYVWVPHPTTLMQKEKKNFIV